VNSEEESRLRAAAEAATAAAFPELSAAAPQRAAHARAGPSAGGGRRSPAVSIAQPQQLAPLQPAFSPDDDDVPPSAVAASDAAASADREAVSEEEEVSLTALGASQSWTTHGA